MGKWEFRDVEYKTRKEENIVESFTIVNTRTTRPQVMSCQVHDTEHESVGLNSQVQQTDGMCMVYIPSVGGAPL